MDLWRYWLRVQLLLHSQSNYIISSVFCGIKLNFLICIFLIQGTTAGFKYEELCYGSDLKLPFDYTPPVFRGPLFFTPSGKGRGHRKLMMDNGEVSSSWCYNLYYRHYSYDPWGQDLKYYKCLASVSVKANQVLNQRRMHSVLSQCVCALHWFRQRTPASKFTSAQFVS